MAPIRKLTEIDVLTQGEVATERIRSVLQEMISTVESPLCRMSVRKLLEAASAVRRRERSSGGSGHGQDKDGTPAPLVWTKEIAQLFGQTLRTARVAEQRSMENDARIMQSLSGVKEQIEAFVVADSEQKGKDKEGLG